MSHIHVIGGGTFSHVRSHMALAAPAFGATARRLHDLFKRASERPVSLHLTVMAGDHSKPKLVTNDDVAQLIDTLIADPTTRVIVMNAALCDYEGQIGPVAAAKYAERLKTSGGRALMSLTPADKIIGRIRKTRKDIFVVGFKTTTGATSDEQYVAGLNLLKANSLNIVVANDTVTRNNMIITPEESRYGESTDRDAVLRQLVEIVLQRSQNTFTRSTLVEGDGVAWDADIIPDNLRAVVEHCIEAGAYKPFRGATVGHFAVKVNEKQIVTSGRKRNFNNLREDGMVLVDYDGDDRVVARGGKPSVGGQSQRIIFTEHPEAECIVHFHCPPRDNAELSHVSQFPNECGSHQCGQATSRGLRPVWDGKIKAVMLDNHGPNIVFSRDTPAEHVIQFIEQNFDLSQKTGGLFVSM